MPKKFNFVTKNKLTHLATNPNRFPESNNYPGLKPQTKNFKLSVKSRLAGSDFGNMYPSLSIYSKNNLLNARDAT